MTPLLIQPGVCRYCRCTEDNACKLETGDHCSWLDLTRTRCTAPACIKAAHAARGRAEFERKKATRKRTPAEVHEQILREKRERRARSRKNRGAA